MIEYAVLRPWRRLDPHAVHVVGPADEAVLVRLAQAALTGRVAVAEVPGASLSDVLERLRAAVDPVTLWSALREIDLPGEPWTVGPDVREKGLKGRPTLDLLPGAPL